MYGRNSNIWEKKATRGEDCKNYNPNNETGNRKKKITPDDQKMTDRTKIMDNKHFQLKYTCMNRE